MSYEAEEVRIESPDVVYAIELLKSGDPLPIDLMVNLLESGVDVAELEEKFGQ